MSKSRRRVSRLLVGAVVLSLGISACSSGQEDSSTGAAPDGGKKSGSITIAYLQKQGDQQYFVDQANGAKDEAKRLGDVKVDVVNLGTDANKAISELDAVIARQVDAIAIVVPDQQIGPQVIQKARAAKIPLVASDDSIKDGSGAEAAFVGFDGRQMGQKVGAKAAALYRAAGWQASDTRIIAAWKQDLSVCTERVEGAADEFAKGMGGSPAPKTIEVGTDNSSTDAQNKTGAVITANQGVKHWIVWGCNDENETGVVTALQNSDVSPADIIGVGLGAYLTCKDWKAGEDSGNKAALFISGQEVGRAAIQTLVASVRDGKPLPPKSIAKTTMVDKNTWQKAGVVCT